MFERLGSDEVEVLWAALIAMVDDVHAPQDQLTDEHWIVAERLRHRLNEIMEWNQV